MSQLFNDLSEGLQQAVDFEKGRGKARVTTFRFAPVKEYSAKDIRGIRMDAGMSQRSFAGFMGVSVKTIEAWECGRNHPTGPARRLLEVLQKNRELALPFVTVEEMNG